MATKFFEHFVYIASAMNNRGGQGIELWDEQDGFYYDVLHFPNGEHTLPARALDGRVDSRVRSRNAGAGDAGPAAGFPQPDAMVHREPAGIPSEPGHVHENAARREAIAFAGEPGAAAEVAELHAG